MLQQTVRQTVSRCGRDAGAIDTGAAQNQRASATRGVCRGLLGRAMQQTDFNKQIIPAS